ncbi:hypothetical protein [Flavobacterium sp. SM2513]|uniref:hypothetical protein n=1 Tax=Flavobacterium sp. SM2513 TaxID=3424766 RepID=UPI003D7FACC6
MKISTSTKIPTKSQPKADETSKKEVSDEKDNRDLENSLTDWNAEHNQSGRHK